MKVLVVDDDPVTRTFVKAVLEMDGYQVFLGRNGEEGLALYRTLRPDLVLTDYLMPGMNGAELTRRIHAAQQERQGSLPVFLPIIVFTGSGEPEVLKECLEAGAVDFLTKPFNVPELRTRIRAISELALANDGLLAKAAEEQDEIAVVKHVLGRLLEQGRATLPAGFEMETLPTRRINGDVCTYHVGAPGIHFGMVCDPMGHGLMAGISEIPTMEVFNDLSSRDLPLRSMLEEINKKLLHLLPFGRFSCITLFRMDWHAHELSVLNAAMPDALLFRADGSLVRFSSTCIPLGIQKDLGSPAVSRLQLVLGDCFLAFSDGLSDVVDEAEIIGLFRAQGQAGFSSRLRELVEARVHNLELADDVTWCLWPFRPGSLDATAPSGPGQPGLGHELGLNLRLGFHPGSLNYLEVGSNLVGFLGRQGVPDAITQTLALLLSESIANAVDHGALGLDSAIKDEGFEAYEAERSSRLATGCRGFVDVQILVHHRPEGAFSHLNVQVSDPGRGFDWRARLEEGDGAAGRPYGRGLLLLRALARDLAFNEAGNEVRFSLYAP